MAILKCLLQAGGNVNAKNNEDRTALHYAVNATTGDYETLTEVENFLVDSGARRDLVDRFGRLPLHYAFTKMGRYDVKVYIKSQESRSARIVGSGGCYELLNICQIFCYPDYLSPIGNFRNGPTNRGMCMYDQMPGNSSLNVYFL